MSDDQEKQAKAMVLLECTETKKRLALLTEQAMQWGRELGSIGDTLQQQPACLSFDGEAMDINLAVQRRDYRAALLDVAKIRALASDIRKTQTEFERLSQRVRELGLS